MKKVRSFIFPRNKKIIILKKYFFKVFIFYEINEELWLSYLIGD